MKRQILFRGYLESLNKWVEGDLVHDSFDGSSRVVMLGIKPMGSFPIPVHPDSVGQFTGLCDMDGNMIFEGDIVDEVNFGFYGSKYLEERIIEIDFSKTTDGIYPSFTKITGNAFKAE